MTRVLVIALQEVTGDLIDPWAEQGLLPNFASLMRTGVTGRVRAQAPLVTLHNWANILTGVNAGSHGVFDHWQRGADGVFRESTSATLGAPPVWSLLRGTGLRSTLINVPLTWPIPDLDGTAVAGTQSIGLARELFSPASLYDRVIAAGFSYDPAATAPGGRKKRDYLGLFDAEMPRMSAAYEYVLKAEPWDFSIVYFNDAGIAQHYFWRDMEDGDDNPYRDVVYAAYRNIDTAIGRLMAAAGPDTAVFIVSECGAGPMRAGIDLNHWLEKQGLLCSRGGVGTALREIVEHQALPWAKRIVPRKLKTRLRDSSATLRELATSSATVLNLDWSRTKVFTRGKEGSLFVNLAGREPQGIVPPGPEYEQLLESVADALLELKDPETGAAVVADVIRPREIYTGAAVEFAPDLIIDWTDAAYMVTERGRGGDGIFVERYRKGMSWPTTGSHRHEGVLMASGPGVRTGVSLPPASHFDLLPTWMAMLGQPVPEQCSGRALGDMLEA